MEFYILNPNEEITAILSTDKMGTHTAVVSAIVEEKLDSYDMLTLTIPADSTEAGLIREDNSIVFEDIKGWREYSITAIEDVDGDRIEMTITAELSSIELLDEVLEEEHANTFIDPEELLEAVLEGTRWSVGVVDPSIYNSSFNESTEFKNVLEILSDISSKYECEVQFSYQISGNKIVNRFVNLYKQFGKDNGKRFEVDKDITEITRTVDITNIKTAIIPHGKEPESITVTDEETGEKTTTTPERLSIKNIEWSVANGDPVDKPLGQSYIGHPKALESWGKKDSDGTKRHRFLSMEFDVDSDSTLASMAWVQLGRYVSPKTTYEVKAVDLYTLTGDEDLKHEYANLGDIVTAVDYYFTRPIITKKRVVELQRDLIDPINNEFVFGESKQSLSVGAVSDSIEEVKKDIGAIAGNIGNVQISINGKAKTFRGTEQPKGMNTGDIWFRPNPLVVGEKQMLIYTGVLWEIQADTADLTDAGRLKFGELDAAKINVINLTADDIQGGTLDLAKGLTVTNGARKVLSVNASTGSVEMNVSNLTINAVPVATKDDLEVESSNATITVDEATYPLYTNKAQDNGAVQPIIYGNTVRDNENLLSVPTEIVSSYYPEQDSEVDINDSNNVKVLAKKWADEYLEYLLHNTTDEEPLAINSLGLVGASYITDNPLWSYTPPTTSTSEAQILVIRGLLKNYTATSEQKWLDLAQKLTDALLQYYYPTPNVPTEPQSHWVPHWLVNVTAPFTSREYFTNGEADFVNGVATVNYNKVFRIYSVRATDATLEYEWSPDSPVVGTSYEIGNTTVEYGQSQATITLKDKTFNGTALVVYSSETGQVINVGDKCEAFPVWRPLEEGEIACAVDALPWALDVFDLWYQITGEEKWLIAIESTKLAILEVSEVSNTKYYIKAGTNGEEVLENGITNFSLRNPKETYTNQDGLILIDYKDSTGNDEGSFGTWVGDKLPLNDQSWIELRAGSNRQEKVSVTIDEESEYSPDKRWKTDFYLNGTGVADTRTVVLKNTDFYKDGGVFWGEQYGREANGGVIASGNSSVTSKTTILDINDKLVKVTELDFVKGDEGGWLGWAQYMLSIWGVSLPFSMKYRTNSDIDFRVNDVSGTPWNYRLPKTGNKFETIYLTEALLTNGQGNFAEGDYQSIILETVSEVSKIEIEYIGNLETYDKDYYSTVNFSYSKQEALQVGIEYIKPAPSRNPLPYSPYILPFDMHYINYKLSNLRGAVYSGYQAPWIFQEAIYTDIEYSLTTNLQFLADAQQAYENLTDYHGFFAPIFWWDYENDSSGREPNTFGMEGNWGEVWGGFQYRSISDVARVFERDPDNARAFNIFVNFIKGVDEYWGDTYTSFPTKFVANQAPHNDQTDSHMVTNFMRSLLYGMKSSRLTDSDKTLIAELFKKCMNYLNHYRIPVRDFDSSLEGTWSPDLQNQTWFQYWGGDILDTLGMVQFQDFSPIKDFIDPIYDLDIKDLEYDKVVNKTYKTKLLNTEPLKKVQKSRDKLFLDPEYSLWKIERKVGVLNWDSDTILQKKTVGSKTLVYTPTNDKKSGSYISDKYNYVDKNGVLYDTQDSIEFVGVLIENENELKLPITFMYELANTTFEVLDSENQRKMNNIISFKGHNYVYTINLEDSKENKITPLISGVFKSATWNTKKKLEEQYATKEELSTKADANALSGQIGELAKDVSDYISSSATKDEVGEIYNSLQEYYVLLNENHLDAQKALEDIHDLVTERIPLIENNLGDFTEKWNFIDTYMVAGEEGFFIGDKVNNTGIRISDDRIDFIGGDLEEPIAYITNQVMKINRAIFVESITVGGHKIETLPSGITIFNWVGSMNG